MKNNIPVIVLVAILMAFGIYMSINSQKDGSSSGSNHSSDTDNKMMKKDTNTDLVFINDMIEHHMGAIVMAKDAQGKSQRDEIKQLSTNIISAQEKEIEMMYGWKKDWFNDTKKVEVQAGGHGSSMTQDLGEADEEFDLRFINAMVEHHQGAIDMANDIFKTTTREEIKNLSQSIVADQTKEINEMNEWKKNWYTQ